VNVLNQKPRHQEKKLDNLYEEMRDTSKKLVVTIGAKINLQTIKIFTMDNCYFIMMQVF
jgi:pyrroline-5-carboxylate reductase